VRKSLSFFLLLYFLCSSIVLSATNLSNVGNVDKSEAPSSIFDRLSEQEVLEISVRTNVDKLLVNKKSASYQSAFIKFAESSDIDAEWRVSIRARGKYRKKVCDFPPLKIKFDHSVLGPENLKAYKSLKLVTHCGDRAETEELLHKEYLAYKIYNTITDQSLRVQLVKINWIDSKGNHEIGEKWGFLIENEDEMAERLGGGIYEEYGVQQADLNPQSAAQNSLFQYMIGNPDWNLESDKNINLIKSNTSREIMIVPYDFDFSGAVNASYAVTAFGLTSVQERIYLGESSTEEISEAVALFKSKKGEVLNQISSYEHLSRSGRNSIKKYIKSFYLSIDEPLKRQAYYQERIDANKVTKSQKGNASIEQSRI
jgi:hypothetical protein